MSINCVFFYNFSETFLILRRIQRCMKLIINLRVGPCHHGMARLQVADGGTASYIEGSCE
jgi:hypothetical protein